jgi:hypothetical protein
MQTKTDDQLLQSNMDFNQSSLDNCRIFQKSQLQMVRMSFSGSGMISSSYRLPDFMQKTPKKLSDFGQQQILACAPHSRGVIHAIISKDSGVAASSTNNSLFYVQYDMLTNKIVKEKRFPSYLQPFLGHNSQSIQLEVLDDPNVNILMLLDGNSTMHPLIELPGSNSLKDSQWMNLFPIKCYSQKIFLPFYAQNMNANNNHQLSTYGFKYNNINSNSALPKSLNFVSLFSMKIERLMTSILRADLSKVTKILRQLEKGKFLLSMK